VRLAAGYWFLAACFGKTFQVAMHGGNRKFHVLRKRFLKSTKRIGKESTREEFL